MQRRTHSGEGTIANVVCGSREARKSGVVEAADESSRSNASSTVAVQAIVGKTPFGHRMLVTLTL